MKRLNSYRLALLSQEGKFSCVKAAQSLPLISHDHLTRLLIKSDIKCCNNLKKLPKNGVIIFDDSVIPKKYSKLIENCSYVYSSSDNKIVFGLSFILIIYVYKSEIYVLDIIIWKKGGPTKNELIREYLKELKENNLSPKYIVFDKWYNAYETLNLIESFQWKYVTLANGNRIFNSKLNDYEIEVESIDKAKNKPKKNHVKDYRYFGANGKFGKLKKVKHIVQIVKNGDRYTLTNILEPLNSVKAWKLYQRRWIIETIFRDLKSFLHLDQCSSRSLKAQKNHIINCLGAYLYLRKKYPDRSVESAHQEFLHKFRKLKPKQIKEILMAA